jgi:prophage maintenance system killer protein
LDANGCVLTSAQDEQVELVLRAASSEIAEEQWTVWGMRAVAPKS